MDLSIYSPFKKLDDVLFACSIYDRLINKFEQEFIFNIINMYLYKNSSFDLINFFAKQKLYPKLFPSNTVTLFKNVDSISSSYINHIKDANVSCILNNCIFCQASLNNSEVFLNAFIFFYEKNSNNCKINLKKCIACNSMHYLSFAINSKNEERKIFNDLDQHSFISFSNEIVYERSILDKLTFDIIFQHNSFSSFTMSFNYFFKSFENSNSSLKLSNKRLAETWLYYRYVLINFEMKNFDLDAFFIKDLDSQLSKINPSLNKYFTKKWRSSEHKDKCTNEKCSQSLVLDGNHKVNRLKCCYEEVDYHVKELGIIAWILI